MASGESKIVKNDKAQTAIPVIECEATEEVRVVCPICGHANPRYTALCKMCSNYLDV